MKPVLAPPVDGGQGAGASRLSPRLGPDVLQRLAGLSWAAPTDPGNSRGRYPLAGQRATNALSPTERTSAGQRVTNALSPAEPTSAGQRVTNALSPIERTSAGQRVTNALSPAERTSVATSWHRAAQRLMRSLEPGPSRHGSLPAGPPVRPDRPRTTAEGGGSSAVPPTHQGQLRLDGPRAGAELLARAASGHSSSKLGGSGRESARSGSRRSGRLAEHLSDSGSQNRGDGDRSLKVQGSPPPGLDGWNESGDGHSRSRSDHEGAFDPEGQAAQDRGDGDRSLKEGSLNRGQSPRGTREGSAWPQSSGGGRRSRSGDGLIGAGADHREEWPGERARDAQPNPDPKLGTRRGAVRPGSNGPTAGTRPDGDGNPTPNHTQLGSTSERPVQPLEPPAAAAGRPDGTRSSSLESAGSDLRFEHGQAPPPADLPLLASQIQRILDEEARRHGIDV